MIRATLLILLATIALQGFSQNAVQRSEYRVLATSRTSTMQKELNEAAQEGFRLESVRGGIAKSGGTEVIAIMSRRADAGHDTRYEYKLLATTRTGTMQKELQSAGDAGFEYVDQTTFDSSLGGNEVVVILEKDRSADTVRYEYKLLATARTSTMQKELQQAGDGGFEFVGMTLANTSLAGEEVVSILRKRIN